MKPGAGKNKGSQFERDTGRLLSLWISKGVREDLTGRTDCSGGRFTRVRKGNAGDLSAADPLSYPFFDSVLIECKHWRDLKILDFLFCRGSMWDAYAKTVKQARELNRIPFFIAKQNNHFPIACFPALPLVKENPVLFGHTLYNGTVYLGSIQQLVDSIHCGLFLTAAQVYLGKGVKRETVIVQRPTSGRQPIRRTPLVFPRESNS